MRAFLALPLPDLLTTRVIHTIAQCRTLAPRARWAGIDTHHVTVRFLGEVREQTVAELLPALARAAARQVPMQLSVRGAGIFGAAAEARVLWLGIANAEPLMRLAEDVTQVLSEHGFQAEERAYHPHLTLARARSLAGDVALDKTRAQLGQLDLGAWSASQLILFESKLLATGPTHTVRARFPFAAPSR